eukprot:c19825_g1_i1.p1 GENE.c19825_g1_i1~~c19825_g1_i1.p1  ORF type:complete len:568 (+),score=202.11 c19825_g1_i1:93-1706(+)
MGCNLRFFVFVSLIFASIFINFDGGALPPILDLLERDLGVLPAQQGALGAIVYLGLTVACPIAGPILQKYPIRIVLMISFILNIAFCFLFALSPNSLFAFISRGGVGFTQSILVVYFPVWIDFHAPAAHATTWMSFMQASAPLGIMVGYCVSGYLAQVFHASWRLAFVVQGFLLLPPFLVITFTPLKLLSISSDSAETIEEKELEEEGNSQIFVGPKSDDAVSFERPRSQSAAMVFVQGLSQTATTFPPILVGENNQFASNEEFVETATTTRRPSLVSRKSVAGKLSRGASMPFITPSLIEITDEKGNIIEKQLTFLDQLKLLWQSRIFVFVVLALSALYFVVTAIQFWVTIYLIEVTGAPRVQVLTAFAVAALTAPTFGVIGGGILIDKLGGYQHTTRCLVILTMLAALAFVCSIPAGYSEDFWTVIGLLWVVLFFGGSILAPATGIILRAVEEEVRPFASSMSMLLYTLLGYAAGPGITGVIYQYFGITWCVRFGLFWGINGFLCLLVALFCSYLNDRKINREQEQKNSKAKVAN